MLKAPPPLHCYETALFSLGFSLGLINCISITYSHYNEKTYIFYKYRGG